MRQEKTRLQPRGDGLPVPEGRRAAPVAPVFQAAAALVLLLALGIILSGGSLFSGQALAAVLSHAPVIALVALAEMLVLAIGGLDLSLGAIAVLSAVVMARLSGDGGMASGLVSVLALAAGLSVGAACGLVNGAATNLLRLPSCLVTLASFILFDALVFLYSGGEAISVDLAWVPLSFAGAFWGVDGVPLAMMALGALSIVYGLRYTAWGKHLCAVGEDVEAARLAGLRPGQVRLGAFVAAGLVSALAAWALAGRAANLTGMSSLEIVLEALAAALIGGATPSSGRMSVLATLLGALAVAVFVVSLRLASVDGVVVRLALGALVLLALAADTMTRLKRAEPRP